MISKIEVQFAVPVEFTVEEMRLISNIVNAAARRTETSDMVHWVAGQGSKLLWREPLEPDWDNSIYFIETCARERFDTEKPCVNCGIDGWKHRGYVPSACDNFVPGEWRAKT